MLERGEMCCCTRSYDRQLVNGSNVGRWETSQDKGTLDGQVSIFTNSIDPAFLLCMLSPKCKTHLKLCRELEEIHTVSTNYKLSTYLEYTFKPGYLTAFLQSYDILNMMVWFCFKQYIRY